ncbi:hypothetical protein RhiirC2_793138 [Rhizophagus irregularis]|uniref:Uncharacterized protein n=1 Tax=Rhizophagus irregularis TaxID=588596 RepID=A0A2N1MFY9_9GLOM|nr:hypothetical protein RhiirC2_793138 [Rhizophagus irregularis]
MKPNNFFRLKQKIISLAEKSKIFQEYTTLNDNFKKRLENENHYQDVKKVREKRPILESPSKWSDIEDEEDRNKAFIAIVSEEIEGNEEEDGITETSPSKKNSGLLQREKEEGKEQQKETLEQETNLEERRNYILIKDQGGFGGIN